MASVMDILSKIKKEMPKDLKNASAEDLMGVLGSLKNMADDVSEEMNKNASSEVKEKYASGFEALDNMIQKGMDDPSAEIDTSGLEDYISAAEKSKEVKKAKKDLNLD